MELGKSFHVKLVAGIVGICLVGLLGFILSTDSSTATD